MPIEGDEDASTGGNTEILNALVIVFSRICGLEEMPLDRLAAAQRALLEVCEELRTQYADHVHAVHSSVYGRFIACRTAAPALEIARELLHRAAERGVPLSIGVASDGRVEPFSDFGMRANLIGIPINYAARLAFVDADWNFICVQTSVATAAEQQKTELAGPMGREIESQVKRTKLRYRRLQTPAPGLAELSVPANPPPDIPVAVVVYDIVQYSEKKLDQAMELVNRLRELVGEVFKELDCLDLIENQNAWYSPAGDGGVVVFRNEYGDRAWEFVQALAKKCREAEVEVRLAAADGVAVIIDQDLPVGATVLRTDKICGYPDTWQIGVDQGFWSRRTNTIHGLWREQQIEDDAAARLLFPVAPGDIRTGPSKPPHEKTDFTENQKLIEDLLRKNPGFSDDLEVGLRGIAFGSVAGGVLTMFKSASLHDFLLALIAYLSGEKNYQYPQLMRELLDLLIPMGVDADQLAALKKSLDGKGGTMAVPETVTEFEAEVLKAAAIADMQINQFLRLKGKLHFEKSGLRGTEFIPESEWVESPGASSKGQPSQLTKGLMKKYGFDWNDPKSMRLLAGKLAGKWLLGEPYFTLSKDKAGEVAAEYADYFLVLKPETKAGEIGVDQTTGVLLQRIFELLEDAS